MDEDRLRPVGGWQEQFALMMHDRIVDLERDLKALRPQPVDPGIRLLGRHAVSHTGAVFARLLTKEPVEADAWSRRVLGNVAKDDDTRYDMWMCHHYAVGHDDTPYITECLVMRSGSTPLAVAKVAHAVRDACGAIDAAEVEACEVTSPAWFAESIRTAAAAAGKAVMVTWDPVAGGCVDQDITELDETGARTPGELRMWTMLHGWLASQVERTDVWHPRALSSSKMAVDLVSIMAQQCLDI